jgi:hypothetical protein
MVLAPHRTKTVQTRAVDTETVAAEA